jgi:hypothetical protein
MMGVAVKTDSTTNMARGLGWKERMTPSVDFEGTKVVMKKERRAKR